MKLIILLILLTTIFTFVNAEVVANSNQTNALVSSVNSTSIQVLFK